MAELSRDGDDPLLTLTGIEKVESAHGDIRVPLSAVSGVEVVDEVIHAVHGLRLPGTRWPGRFMIGTLAHATSKKSFAVIHHDTPRGVRVRLDGAAFDELLVGCGDPEAVVAGLSLPG